MGKKSVLLKELHSLNDDYMAVNSPEEMRLP